MRLIARLCLTVALVTGSTAHAEVVVSPDWTADRILSQRPNSPGDVDVVTFSSRTREDGKPDIVKSGTVRLWDDVDQISVGALETVTDYKLCRSFSWRGPETVFNNASCFALPAFQQLELRNRIQLSKLLVNAKALDGQIPSFEDAVWSEQELSTQKTPSRPLTIKRSSGSVEWWLGAELVVKTSASGHQISSTDRTKFLRYFSRYLRIHPQVRRDIIDSGIIPSQIEISHRRLDGKSVETILFSSWQTSRMNYPLPPQLTSEIATRSNENSAEAAGIRSTLNALSGVGEASKASFESLLDQLEGAAKRKEALQTTLTFLKITQVFGGLLMADGEKMEQIRSLMPIVQPLLQSNEASKFMQASSLAGTGGEGPEREASAAYLADAQNLDQIDFGTFRYVTFANLVQISTGTKTWDEAIFRKMPSLTDSYWTHIAAFPWASNAFKDLGDTWYSQFETYKAWEAWDLGKAVDPDWQRGSMNSVDDLEKRIRLLMPDSF